MRKTRQNWILKKWSGQNCGSFRVSLSHTLYPSASKVCLLKVLFDLCQILSLFILNFHSISVQILFHICSISVQFLFHICSISAQFLFHFRSISVQFPFKSHLIELKLNGNWTGSKNIWKLKSVPAINSHSSRLY